MYGGIESRSRQNLFKVLHQNYHHTYIALGPPEYKGQYTRAADYTHRQDQVSQVNPRGTPSQRSDHLKGQLYGKSSFEVETPAAGGEPRTRGLLGTPKAETPQPQGWLWGILGQPGTPAPVDVTEAKDLYGGEKPEKTT